jgi:uncharacterized protein (DUF433 family)
VLFIAGTRMPVTTILGLLWGVSTADALAYYPQLVSDDVWPAGGTPSV